MLLPYENLHAPNFWGLENVGVESYTLRPSIYMPRIFGDWKTYSPIFCLTKSIYMPRIFGDWKTKKTVKGTYNVNLHAPNFWGLENEVY